MSGFLGRGVLPSRTGFCFLGLKYLASPILEIIGWWLASVVAVGQSIERRFAGPVDAKMAPLHLDDEAIVRQLAHPFRYGVFMGVKLLRPGASG